MEDERIQIRHDRPRGCGMRKPGGLYMVSDGTAAPCGKLPVPLERCPTCSHGIKFSRGWTWVDADTIIGDADCTGATEQSTLSPLDCETCPMREPHFGRSGLLWIGEKFYPTPADWLREARTQGISRRIHAIPLDFKLGETWILTAHIKAIRTRCDHPVLVAELAALEQSDKMVPPLDPKKCVACAGAGVIFTPGIFQIFKPEAVEYVVTGSETTEEIDALIKRGITPVRIEPVEDQPDLVSEAVS